MGTDPFKFRCGKPRKNDISRQVAHVWFGIQKSRLGMAAGIVPQDTGPQDPIGLIQ